MKQLEFHRLEKLLTGQRWDFPTTGFTCRGLKKVTPEKSIFCKLLPRGRFLTPNRVFNVIVRINQFTGMGCARGYIGIKKTKQKMQKDTRPLYVTTKWERHR